MPSRGDDTQSAEKHWNFSIFSDTWYDQLIRQEKWETLMRFGLYDDRVYYALFSRHNDLWKTKMLKELHLSSSSDSPRSDDCTSSLLPGLSSADSHHNAMLSGPSPLWLKFVARGMGYEEMRASLSVYFSQLAAHLHELTTKEREARQSHRREDVFLLQTKKEGNTNAPRKSDIEANCGDCQNADIYRTENIAGLEKLICEYGRYACATSPPSFSTNFLIKNASLFTQMVDSGFSLSESSYFSTVWLRSPDAVLFAPCRAAVRLVAYACTGIGKEVKRGTSTSPCFNQSPLALECLHRAVTKEVEPYRTEPTTPFLWQKDDKEKYSSQVSSHSAYVLTRFCQEFPEFLEETNKLFCFGFSGDVVSKRFAVLCLSLLSGAYYLCCGIQNPSLATSSAPFLSLGTAHIAEERKEWRMDSKSSSFQDVRNAERELYRVEAYTYASSVVKPEAMAYGGGGFAYALARFWASTPSSSRNSDFHRGGSSKWRWRMSRWGGVHDFAAFLSPEQQIRHRFITILCRASLSAVSCALLGVYSHSLLDWRRTQLLLSPALLSASSGVDEKIFESDITESYLKKDLRNSYRVIRREAITYSVTSVLLAATAWRVQSVSFPQWMGDVCFRFPWMIRLFPAVVGLSPSSFSSFAVSSSRSLVPYVVAPFLFVSWWRSPFNNIQ